MIAIIVFTVQSYIFRFVKLSGTTIVIEGIFVKDVSCNVDELTGLSEILPLIAIMKISFGKNHNYFFLGKYLQ